MDTMDTLSSRIKYLIKINNLTQKQFADSLKVTPAFISEIIKNKSKPNDSTLNLISILYNINFEWLKYGKGEIFAQNKSLEVQNIIDILNSLDKDHQKAALVLLKELYDLNKKKYL